MNAPGRIDRLEVGQPVVMEINHRQIIISYHDLARGKQLSRTDCETKRLVRYTRGNDRKRLFYGRINNRKPTSLVEFSRFFTLYFSLTLYEKLNPPYEIIVAVLLFLERNIKSSDESIPVSFDPVLIINVPSSRKCKADKRIIHFYGSASDT